MKEGFKTSYTHMRNSLELMAVVGRNKVFFRNVAIKRIPVLQKMGMYICTYKEQYIDPTKMEGENRSRDRKESHRINLF